MLFSVIKETVRNLTRTGRKLKYAFSAWYDRDWKITAWQCHGDAKTFGKICASTLLFCKLLFRKINCYIKELGREKVEESVALYFVNCEGIT